MKREPFSSSSAMADVDMVSLVICGTEQHSAVQINDLKEMPAGLQIVIRLSCWDIDTGCA